MTLTVHVGKSSWIVSRGFPCLAGTNNLYYSDAFSNTFFVLQEKSLMSQLSPSDLQTPAHEIFNAVQGQLLNGRCIKLMPHWLIEGSAQFIGAYFSEKSNLASYEATVAVALSRYSTSNVRPLSDYTYQNYQSSQPGELVPYGIGLLATSYIVASTSFKSFLDIFKRVGSGEDFDSAFYASTGLTIDEFYKKFELVADNWECHHSLSKADYRRALFTFDYGSSLTNGLLG